LFVSKCRASLWMSMIVVVFFWVGVIGRIHASNYAPGLSYQIKFLPHKECHFRHPPIQRSFFIDGFRLSNSRIVLGNVHSPGLLPTWILTEKMVNDIKSLLFNIHISGYCIFDWGLYYMIIWGDWLCKLLCYCFTTVLPLYAAMLWWGVK